MVKGSIFSYDEDGDHQRKNSFKRLEQMPPAGHGRSCLKNAVASVPRSYPMGRWKRNKESPGAEPFENTSEKPAKPMFRVKELRVLSLLSLLDESKGDQ